ncbi:unnamed protein product, partial [marine sediment metagenome]
EIEIKSAKEVTFFAVELRKFLNINLEKQVRWANEEEAFNNWRKILQDFGIFIFKDAFKNDEISGFCLYDLEFPIIYINNSHPKTRQIFTLFHEIGHLLMKTSGIDKEKDDFIDRLSQTDKSVELFCNKLAGEFLVPEKDFISKIIQLKTIDEESISKFANYYKVSREVILRKLLIHGYINNDIYNDYSLKWIEQAKFAKKKHIRKVNYYNIQIAYLGDYYLDLVFDKYYKNQINISDVADFLNTKVGNIPEFEERFILKKI